MRVSPRLRMPEGLEKILCVSWQFCSVGRRKPSAEPVQKERGKRGKRWVRSKELKKKSDCEGFPEMTRPCSRIERFVGQASGDMNLSFRPGDILD